MATRKNTRRSAGLVLIAALLLSAPAFAAPPGPPGPPPGDDKGWKQVEMVRLWKLAEVLDLSEEEFAKLIPTLKEYNTQLRDKTRDHDQALKRLMEAVKATDKKPEAKAVQADIRRILQTEEEVVKLRQAHYRKMESHLPPEKLAKYMVFDARFHDEIRGFLQEMRQGRRGDRMRRPRFDGPNRDDLPPGPPEDAPPDEGAEP